MFMLLALGIRIARTLLVSALLGVIFCQAARAQTTPTSVVPIVTPSLQAQSVLRGSCAFASFATERPDAYRCGSGLDVYDPCFFLAQTAVMCPVSLTAGIEILLSQPLPEGATPVVRPATAADVLNGPGRVWQYTLQGGRQCRIVTRNALAQLPWSCGDGLVCTGPQPVSPSSRDSFALCVPARDGTIDFASNRALHVETEWR